MTTSNIKPISPDQWEVRFAYTDPLTGSLRRCKRRVKGDEIDAQIALRELKRQAEEGNLSTVTERERKQPLSSWLEPYLVFLEGKGLAHSTLLNERQRLQGAILRDCGQWLPQGIKPRHIESLTALWSKGSSRQSKGALSAYTVRNRVATLRRFLAWVHKHLDLPPLGETAPIKGQTPKRGRALTRREARLVLEGCKALYPHWYALLVTLLFTGQRMGSVTALRWSDVDFEGQRITFSTSQYQGRVKAGNKSHKVLTLPLSSLLLEALAAHRELCAAEEHLGWRDTDLVFYARKSKDPHITASSLRGAISQICKQTGVSHFSPHDLRRTFNTWMLETGISETVLRSLTGHSSASMTAHYYHPSAEGHKSALALLDGLLQG